MAEDTGGFERIGPVDTGGFERVEPPKPGDSYTGTVLPIRKDAQGLHLAWPEMLAAPVRGAAEMGKRAVGEGEAGQNPLRPLSPDAMSTLFALTGTRAAGMADMGMLGPSTLTPGGALAQERLTALHPLEQTAETIKASGETLSKAIVDRSPEAAERFIQNAYNRAIRPTVAGKGSAAKITQAEENVLSGLSSIISQKSKLKLADGKGREVVGRNPETLDEFLQAIGQTKEAVFEKYNSLTQQADALGSTIDVSPVAGELRKFVNDPSFDLPKFEPMKSYASATADTLERTGSLRPSVAQGIIKNLNEGLTAFYRSSSPEAASKAAVDDLVANMLRGSVDATLERSGLPGWREARLEYGALKSLESEVAHRAVVFGRRDPGGGLFGRLGNIASYEELARFAVTHNPAALASAMAIRGGRSLTEWLHSPNRAVKKMFETAERMEKRGGRRPPSADAVQTGGMQPPRPTGMSGIPRQPTQPGVPAPPGGYMSETVMGMAPVRPFPPPDPYGNTVIPGGGGAVGTP